MKDKSERKNDMGSETQTENDEAEPRACPAPGQNHAGAIGRTHRGARHRQHHVFVTQVQFLRKRKVDSQKKEENVVFCL